MANETRQSWESVGRGIMKLVLAIVLVIVGVLVSIVATIWATRLPFEPIVQAGVGQFLGGLFAVLGVVLLGGKRWLAPRGKAVFYTFRIAWVLLLIGIIAIGVSIFELTTIGQGIPDGAPMRLAGVVLLVLGIGIAEEFTYRGLVLGGLLAAIGRSRAGVMAAVLISAVLFGFAHVGQDDFNESITAIQAILKIVQTGMFGIVMSAAVLQTRNLWGAVVFHTFNDFLYLGVPAMLAGESAAGSYTISGDAGMVGIGVYIFMIIVFLFPTIRALRIIWRKQQFCLGPFMEPRKRKGEMPPSDDGKQTAAAQPERAVPMAGGDEHRMPKVVSGEAKE